MTNIKFISFFKGLKSENLINFYNKGDSTAILLETSVVCDGRPKSGVRSQKKKLPTKAVFHVS